MPPHSRADTRPDRGIGWLALIWAIGVLLDRIWIGLDHGLPTAIAATQLNQLASRLPGSWAAHRLIFQNLIFHSLGAIVQAIGGFEVAHLLWTQAIFSALLLVSVYGLGSRLFGPMVGRWSAGFVVILPAIVTQRLTFTEDLSVVAWVMLGLWRLVAWQSIGTANLGVSGVWSNQPSEPIVEHSSGFQEIKQLQKTLTDRWPDRSTQRSTQRSWPGVRLLRSWPRIQLAQSWTAWVSTVSLGIVYGLGAIAHPLIWLNLAVPFGLAGLVQLGKQRWGKVAQWLVAGAIGLIIAEIGTQHQRPHNLLAALRNSNWNSGSWRWQFDNLRFAELAHQSFYPLLIAGGVGLLLYQQRAGITQLGGRQVVTTGAVRRWRRQLQQSGLKAIGQLGVWIVAALLLAMGLPGSHELGLLCLLPLVIIGATQGLLLLPDRWFSIRWLVLSLMIVWSVSNFFPIIPLQQSQQLPRPKQNWHQTALLTTIAHSQEGTQPTIGISANSPEWNAATLTYLSRLQSLPATIQPIRTDEPATAAFDWYILRSDMPKANENRTETQAIAAQQTAIFQKDPALQLAQSWNLPDNSQIQLYRRRSPMVEITPIVGAQWSEDLPIKLERVTIPAQAAPGQVLPITYQWAGRPADLQVGWVAVTWQSPQASAQAASSANNAPESSPLDPVLTNSPWWQDHPIGLGQLQSSPSQAELVQVTERLATRVPADAKGRYGLEITYLNPLTGDRYPLLPPETSIEITASASAKPGDASAIDLMTQGHSLAQRLVQTPDLAQLQLFLDYLDRHDPQQQGRHTWQRLIHDRLIQSPENPILLADWALAQALQANFSGAMDALQRFDDLRSVGDHRAQPNNPNLPLYQAIVAAAIGQGNQAQTYLNASTIPVPEPVKTLIAAVRGNPIARWHCWRWQLAGVMAGDRMADNPSN